MTGLQKKAAFLCWRVEAAGGPPANRSIRSGRKRDAGAPRMPAGGLRCLCCFAHNSDKDSLSAPC